MQHLLTPSFPRTPSKRRFAARRLVLVGCLLLSSCGWLMPSPQVRGNKIDPDSMKELTPGTSTKADVSAIIGSPTARDTFDDDTWLYISELTQQRIGRTLGELKQNVVVLNFDDKGVLKTIKTLDKEDSLPVSVIARTTASPGTEASFLQQLLGNIGRFNPAGATAPGTAAGGGTAGGAPGAP
ncbi:outer membrane protein assembly factor BamE [Rhodopila sp.]|uniref:outer membrane protein assembly factor BamE n=1 Tax=Rhodopila sp. TaxID=2480087 RepID=UPI003D0B9B74